MNQDVLRTLSDDEKKRKNHPYWIYESMQMIPELLTECLDVGVRKQIWHVLDQFKKRNIKKIIFTGRGSSYFLTSTLNYLFHELTQLPTAS